MSKNVKMLVSILSLRSQLVITIIRMKFGETVLGWVACIRYCVNIADHYSFANQVQPSYPTLAKIPNNVLLMTI
jgi:hypothetical protein